MKKCFLVFAACCFLCINLTAQGASYNSPELMRGFEAYRKADWTNAMFFLRKACADPKNSSDELLYMLIMSEMYAGEYPAAKADCDTFFMKYPESRYTSYIHYQDGRALHFLNQNENSVLVLSDFCHQNPDHDLYPSALYWIAECFYDEYNFDSARGLYERIVNDYPNDAKVVDAQYRIEMIDQRGREEKLLYLLKVTGEETLAAREDYERQLRLYQAEDKLGLKKQLVDAQKRVAELEAQLDAEKTYSANVQRKSSSRSYYADQPIIVPPEGSDGQSESELEALKRKARQLQFILNEQLKGE